VRACVRACRVRATSDGVWAWQDSHAEKARTALAYAMNEDFSRVLAKQMEYFSQGGGQDKVDKVKAEMDDVKNVMVDNIEKVLKRGEKIELLVDKTDNLNQQSIRFKKHSTQLKQAMWCVWECWPCVRAVLLYVRVRGCGWVRRERLVM
jgi:vesicle-associated membrane protein 7